MKISLRTIILTIVFGFPILLEAGTNLTRQKAVTLAQEEVPQGKILSVEREREGGHDVWSLDVQSGDGKHVIELQYDVETGKLLSRKEESPEEQKREAATDSTPAFRVLNRSKVGGEGGWDYLTVDAAARRLYITRSTRVMVLDADTLKPVGEIPDTPGVHGVAIASSLGRGFTSNGKAGTATIFDLKSLKRIVDVKVSGENPDAILFDDFTKRVFTFNGNGQNATAIEAATGKILATIPFGGKPEFAATDLHGRVFVNIEDKSEVAEIDAEKLVVLHRWPLAPCEEPSGMAIDRAHARLFIGCSNEMMAVLDSSTGRVVTTLPIGKGVDANAFDSETGLAYSSNGDGTLTIVHEDSPDRFSIVANVATQKGARTMALDEKTHRVFLVTAEFGPAPAPSAEHPHPRPSIVPESFVILTVGK
jgi:DNA-binding beta-propeller fold protein YncE